ncbi:hypothetical protein HDU86_004215 [Geranomyces michiganensis]|nr:hypothetical protein HDU86_004215 [Geranomyces michiganensis]
MGEDDNNNATDQTVPFARPPSASPPPRNRRLLVPPSPVAPRSSSLPPPQRRSSRPTAAIDEDNNVEAAFDFMAKVPTLSMFGFGFGTQAGVSADSTSDEDFDEGHELMDLSRERAPKGAAVAADERGEDSSNAGSTGPTSWSGGFGFNMPQMPALPQIPALPQMLALPAMPALPTMPAMPSFPTMPALPSILPSLSKFSSTTPLEEASETAKKSPQYQRDPSPDASAGTAAASAIKKAWSSITKSYTRHLRPCGHRHPFHFLEGDLVLLGGMYGSFLADKKTGQTAWLSTDHLFGFAKVNVGLSLEDVDDSLVPAGVLDRIGPINICADLCREFTAQSECSNGKFRFSPFGYDWRRDPGHSAKALERHLEEIYARNGGNPIVVVAHSMGGLVTLAVVNRRPDLIRGVVFVGTPFGGVPCILWQLRRGIPFFLNKNLMSPDLHFAARSSFVFLPMDGRALVVDAKQNGAAPATPASATDDASASGEEDYLVDFYSAEEWIHNTLSQTLHRATKASAAALETHKQYLQRTLHAAKAFRQSLAFDPDKKYPPLTHLVSTAWPTPTRIKCTTTAAPKPPKSAPPPSTSPAANVTSPAVIPRVETKFLWPTRFKDGDGVVARESMTLPPGFDVSYVDTAIGHWGSMNDMSGIRACLKKIVQHERKGKNGGSGSRRQSQSNDGRSASDAAGGKGGDMSPPLPVDEDNSALSDPELLHDDLVPERRAAEECDASFRVTGLRDPLGTANLTT